MAFVPSPILMSIAFTDCEGAVFERFSPISEDFIGQTYELQRLSYRICWMAHLARETVFGSLNGISEDSLSGIISLTDELQLPYRVGD